MKTLYLLRHAKAEPGSAALKDEDRPLSARGREACKIIGRYMRQKQYVPQLILCSSSTRTRETMERVVEHAEFAAPHTLEKKLYLATTGEMLAVLQAMQDEFDAVLLIGHNPGMHHLAAVLASAEHTKLREKLEIKYPTGALAVLGFGVDHWKAISPDLGELKDFITPGEL